MELPNLQVLLLEQLSRIVCFSLGCYDFLFPHLEKLEVFECPKLITKFATTPNGSIRAQSEVLLNCLDFLLLFLCVCFLFHSIIRFRSQNVYAMLGLDYRYLK